MESQALSQQREEDEEKCTVFAASKLKSHGFLNIGWYGQSFSLVIQGLM